MPNKHISLTGSRHEDFNQVIQTRKPDGSWVRTSDYSKIKNEDSGIMVNFRSWKRDTPFLTQTLSIDVAEDRNVKIFCPFESIEACRTEIIYFDCTAKNKNSGLLELIFAGTISLS